MKSNRRRFLKFLLVSSGILLLGKMLGLKWFSRQAEAKILNIESNLHVTNRLRIPVGSNMYD